MKMRPVIAELLHGDRQRNMTKLTTAFWNFANGPKNCPQVTYSDNHASSIQTQTRNSDWLVSFEFFCRPNYQSVGRFKYEYLNLILQGTWQCSFAACPTLT